MKILDHEGLKELTKKIKQTIPTKTSELTNDSGFVTTDTKVTQTVSTTDASYEVLFAGSTSTTTATEGAGKSTYLYYNPSSADMTIKKNSGGYNVVSTDGNYSCALMVGAGGVNRGLYDFTNSKWMVYSNSSEVILNGNAATATKATQDVNGLQIDTNYMLVSRGTSIPSGADLNEYTTFGTYYSNNSDITRSLLNTPSLIYSNARLDVFASSGAMGDSTYLFQRLSANSAYCMMIWQRAKTSEATGWGPWHLLAGNDFTKFSYDLEDVTDKYIKIATYKTDTTTYSHYDMIFNI